MDCLEAIRTRHSYRGAFKPDPVSVADREAILAAAAAAPSGCNKEFTQFVWIDAPEVRAAIAEHVDGPATRTAPALLVVVGDPAPAYRGTSFELADTAACVMNAWLAMTALGYATVWLDGQLRGGADAKIAELLGLPAPLVARILLPVGRPEAEIKPPPKKPLAERVHYNRW